MKKLSIEQKAKLYDEAIEELRGLLEGIHEEKCDIMEEDIIKIFPELKDEDEKIRKALFEYFTTSDNNAYYEVCGVATKKILVWLEKQGEKIVAIENFDTEFEKQVSYLIASSMNKEHEYSLGYVTWVSNALLNYAKHELEKQGEQKPYGQRQKCVDCQFNYAGECKGSCSMKQGEQKPFDYEHANIQQTDFAPKVEPKFKVGDWVVNNNSNIVYQVENVIENLINNKYGYDLVGGYYISSFDVDKYHLWNIQDAKDSDVLATDDGICIFDGTLEEGKYPFAHCGITKRGFDSYDVRLPFSHDNNIQPATKEQCDLLFQKMKDAGYEWDAENKELRKIYDENYDGEDYGIDGLWHAQKILEKTLGKVDGYQTDDGILSHKCAITAVNKLYKQKPAWNEKYIADVFEKVGLAKIVREQVNDELTCAVQDAMIELSKFVPQSNPAWSEENEDYINDLIQYFSQNEKLENTKEDIVIWLKSLKGKVQLQPMQEWNEEDEETINFIKALCDDKDDVCHSNTIVKKETDGIRNWLKSIKDRVQPKQEWSEKDEKMFDKIYNMLFQYGYDSHPDVQLSSNDAISLINWLKSLRPQNTWKPSEEQLNAFDAVLVYNPPCSNECRNHLITLYNDLKKLREE